MARISDVSLNNIIYKEATKPLVITLYKDKWYTSDRCNPMNCFLTRCLKEDHPDVTRIATLRTVAYVQSARGWVRYALKPEARNLIAAFDTPSSQPPDTLPKTLEFSKVLYSKTRSAQLAIYHGRRAAGKDKRSHARSSGTGALPVSPKEINLTRRRILEKYFKACALSD
jgi:hypothetical protein